MELPTVAIQNQHLPVFVEFIFFDQVPEGRHSWRDFHVMLHPRQLVADRMNTVRIAGPVTLHIESRKNVFNSWRSNKG